MDLRWNASRVPLDPRRLGGGINGLCALRGRRGQTETWPIQQRSVLAARGRSANFHGTGLREKVIVHPIAGIQDLDEYVL